MLPLVPSDTIYFTCTGVTPLPTARVPRGCSVKLSPETYFRAWSRVVDSQSQVYLGADFSRLVLPNLEPVMVNHELVRRAVFSWRPRPNVSVTWGDVYKNFPVHGSKADDHQVVPWQHLQELVFGWASVSAVIPRDAQGALFMMGNAGLPVSTPSGATVRGSSKFLVQCGFFATVGPATWVLGLPNRESSDQLLSPNTTVITIQSY